ncbi:hypothetical protein A4A49_64256, partial [Nicotiana attenuata]
MGKNDFWKKTNRLTDNRDSEPVKSSKKLSIDENLLTQPVEELVYPGNCNMIIVEKEISYYYGGHFVFSPSRKYVGGHLKNTNIDVDFISFFDLLDDLKEYCNFNICEGDKFFYLRGDRIISDYDGLVECHDDEDIK